MIVELFTRQGPGPLPPPPPQHYLDENLAPKMLAVNGTLFGLALLFVLLRVYVRAVMLKTFGIDDWIMVLAAILSTACFSLFFALTRNGVGRHAEFYIYVRPDLLSVFFQLAWWYAWIVVVAYTSIKISIAYFLLRLANHRRHWRWVLYTTIITLLLFTVGSVLSLILQCTPIRAAWDFSLRSPFGDAVCYSPTTYRNTGVFNSVFNLFTDLLLAILPVPMVWKLQTNLKTRISLCVVLGLGLFACGTAVYKIPLQYSFFDEKDFSGKGAWYYIWQQIEMNVGIIAACLPTLKPLAANFFGAVSALTSGERYGSQYASRDTTKGRSRPYDSSGYLKQTERSGKPSYVLEEIDARYKAESPSEYQFPPDDEVAYVVGQRRGSSAAESDESILRQHKGILRTTEVRVS